jgi:sec-independent protein translocase protein TatA
MGLRLPEVLIILVVLVLVFGANKIPQLGDALGKGIRNFKKASSKDEDDSIDVTPKSQPAQQGQLPQGAATTSPSSVTSEKKA